MRLLQELPQRPPVLDEAKVLADAVNLDDFGAGGSLRLAGELATRGHGISSVARGWETRHDYGYWRSRLNDGFHFAASRAIARRRLDNARRLFEMLAEERDEDGDG